MGLLSEGGDPYANWSDAALLARAQEQPAAFEVFARRHYAALLSVLERLCRDRDKARELANDTLFKAYRKAHTYTPREGATARSWLFRIAFTTFLSHYRAEKRHATVPFDPETEWALREASVEWYGDEEIRNVVAAAFRKLPVEAARVLRRYYLEGYSCSEIAQMEGISYAAVKVRLFRARLALKRVLIAQGYGYAAAAE